MMTQEVQNFIKDVYEGDYFEGVRYMYLDDELALVFTYSEDDDLGLCCKIAYNCDALQCDYDCDWYMPLDEDGNVFDTEIINCKFWTFSTLVAVIDDTYIDACHMMYDFA